MPGYPAVPAFDHVPDSVRVIRRGARVRIPAPVVIDVAIATLAVLLIASPLLFTSDGDTGLCADKTPGSEFEPSIAH